MFTVLDTASLHGMAWQTRHEHQTFCTVAHVEYDLDLWKRRVNGFVRHVDLSFLAPANAKLPALVLPPCPIPVTDGAWELAFAQRQNRSNAMQPLSTHHRCRRLRIFRVTCDPVFE